MKNSFIFLAPFFLLALLTTNLGGKLYGQTGGVMVPSLRQVWHNVIAGQIHLDTTAWNTAHEKGISSAYKTYLRFFPGGWYQADANYWITQNEYLLKEGIRLEDKSARAGIQKRNMLNCVLTNDNVLLVRGKEMPFHDLPEEIRKFVLNPLKQEVYSTSEQEALLFLYVEVEADEEHIEAVFQLVRTAYFSMWREKSLYHFGVPFTDSRARTRRAGIRGKIPFNVIPGVDIRQPEPPPPPRPVIEDRGN